MKLEKTQKRARQLSGYFDRKTDALQDDAKTMAQFARDSLLELPNTAELEVEEKTSPALVVTIGACFGFILGVAVTIWVL